MLLKMVQPASFSFIFGLFKQTIIFLQQINVKCPSSIRYRDSNPRPLDRESTPITTRPGLPPNEHVCACEKEKDRVRESM